MWEAGKRTKKEVTSRVLIRCVFFVAESASRHFETAIYLLLSIQSAAMVDDFILLLGATKRGKGKCYALSATYMRVAQLLNALESTAGPKFLVAQRSRASSMLP